MSYRVDPEVAEDLAKYGGETATECFNCGNCTAVCALSENENTFPRKFIRYIQLGLTGKMKESFDPWLCYYCGDCSDTCPREAEPGEMMMAARRWLTSVYDWTGISKLMYKHEAWEFGFLAIAAIVVLLLFTLPANFGFRLLAEHPEARGNMMLQFFAPKEIVHWGDIVLALMLGFLLLSNAFRMFLWTMKDSKANIGDYIAEFMEMIIHLFTQKRWVQCDSNMIKHWVRHIFLFTGYAIMLLLVVIFLPWFQVDDTSFHWTAFPGYYATVVLLVVTGWIIIDRMNKRDQIHKYSHLSDWMFPILLFLTALTGILMHIFRLFDLAMQTYIIYVIHLMIAVPMLVIEVPFGKWAHLLYRPMAMYFVAVRKRAAARVRATRSSVATAA